MKKIYFIFLFSNIFLLAGCISSPNNNVGGGIAISFDDRFIDEWYQLRPLLRKYDAKVTFFVTCSDSLTADEIHKLKELEKDGHEIGFHGSIHGKSTEMIKNGAQYYEETELTPGLNILRSAGFYPTSYAHPGGNHNQEVDEVLFSNGFAILRDVTMVRRVAYGIPLYTISPRNIGSIYYTYGQERTVHSLLIDYGSGITLEGIHESINKASRTGTALMLFGHKPLKEAPKNGEYGFSITLLEEILNAAKRMNLQFFTMTELQKVGLNQ